MHPVLFRVGGLTIYSYGVMLFLSFIIGIYLAERRAKGIGVKPRLVSDLALWVLAGAVVGSRALYVLLHWNEFKDDPISIIAFWRGGLGGLMFYGGFLLALLAGIWFVRRHKLPLLKMFDIITPAVALGEFLTRIGCFLNGCCFGKTTRSFLGVTFPDNSAAGSAALKNPFPIHPTQLYSSFAGLVLFVLVLSLEKKRGLKPGVLFSIFLFLYSGFRFGIDFVRYYEDLSNFLVNQIIAAGLMIIAITLFLMVRKNGAESKVRS